MIAVIFVSVLVDACTVIVPVVSGLCLCRRWRFSIGVMVTVFGVGIVLCVFLRGVGLGTSTVPCRVSLVSRGM
ncbi:hypothetical protein [Natronomonas salsuginis]|uniref:Uncharacterized protein n=1 Tax=Natronomonas salsuginis TaxID=2217661 RepID=A0A4U5JA54_9EURY|nr:hypothetical protein [Natronomonas salsuginis]TKR25131.1 hypothetical protein DM868_12335 [Natronomonas salsuginis]